MTTTYGPTETRVYVGVGSDSLTLEEVSVRLGLQPTGGWSIGELTRRGSRQESTFLEVDSGCSRESSHDEHLRGLIDRAERVAAVVDASQGVLDYARLEVVESFRSPAGARLLVLDERWLRALQRMHGWLDVDQYIAFTTSDAERPECPEEIMLGQTLRLRLRPISDPHAAAVELTEDERFTSEMQDVVLREFLGGLDAVPDGGYVLEIEQTMITRVWTETGFGLSRETLAEAYPKIREIRLHTTVLPDDSDVTQQRGGSRCTSSRWGTDGGVVECGNS